MLMFYVFVAVAIEIVLSLFSSLLVKLSASLFFFPCFRCFSYFCYPGGCCCRLLHRLLFSSYFELLLFSLLVCVFIWASKDDCGYKSSSWLPCPPGFSVWLLRTSNWGQRFVFAVIYLVFDFIALLRLWWSWHGSLFFVCWFFHAVVCISVEFILLFSVAKDPFCTVIVLVILWRRYHSEYGLCSGLPCWRLFVRAPQAWTVPSICWGSNPAYIGPMHF